MTYINFHAINNLAPGACWSLNNNSYEELDWHSEDIEKPTLEALVAETERIEANWPWDRFRTERNKRLAETDWWVLPDRTPTDEQLAYRQALRDLPDNTVDPENPVWPTEPS